MVKKTIPDFNSFVCFDFETTGLEKSARVIEIGAVKVTNGVVVDRFSTFVNPQTVIPSNIEELTSISNSMVSDAPIIEDILPKLQAKKLCSKLQGDSYE